MKHRKLLCLLLALCMAASLLPVTALAAGQNAGAQRSGGDSPNNELPHKHDWSQAWSRDADAHWHECLSDGCPVTDNAKK